MLSFPLVLGCPSFLSSSPCTGCGGCLDPDLTWSPILRASLLPSLLVPLQLEKRTYGLGGHIPAIPHPAGAPGLRLVQGTRIEGRNQGEEREGAGKCAKWGSMVGKAEYRILCPATGISHTLSIDTKRSVPEEKAQLLALLWRLRGLSNLKGVCFLRLLGTGCRVTSSSGRPDNICEMPV